MIEFAIILPMIVVLVFGIIEIGRSIYQLNTLTKAVAVGARYLARGYEAIDVDNNCQTVSEKWNPLVPNAINLISYGHVDSDVNPMLIPDISIDNIVVRAETASNGVTACVIRIEASAPFMSLFANDGGGVIPFTDIGGFRLSSSTEERYIGE